MAADPITRSAIDDVFNDDFSDLDDDIFADKPTLKDQRDDKTILSPRVPKRKADDDGDAFGLGLDEEVKIAKKRKPLVKLDEARLLSEPGIPKLRNLVRSKQISRKLRIKGKGHEFSDAARLLNHFQLWLDNLYPRAKFADALQMVEKAGHTKRMQMTRVEWINESKPGYVRSGLDGLDVTMRSAEDPDLFETTTVADARKTGSSKNQKSPGLTPDDSNDHDVLFIPDANLPLEDDRDNEPDDDELDALLAEQDEELQAVSRPASRAVPADRREDSEGEDDLDALLAEQYARQNNSFHRRMDEGPAEEEDDLDALLAEQEVRQSVTNTRLPANKETARVSYDESDDDVFLIHKASRARQQQEAQDYDHNDLLKSGSPAVSTEVTDKVDSQSQDLIEESLSSSPVPNHDGNLDAAPTEQEVPLIGNGYAVEAKGIPEGDGIELEEDFLPSSPVDPSQ